MRPGDKHKARASREYQKKHGLVPAKQSKKQKEKAAIAKLESNWDRYDDSSEHYETKGLSLQELLGRAKAPSAFLTPALDSSFHPKYKYPIKIQDWEVGLAGLDLSKLLKNVSVSAGSEQARYLNKKQESLKKVDPIEEILYDPLYELVRNPGDSEVDEEEQISPEGSPLKERGDVYVPESAMNNEHYTISTKDETTEKTEKSTEKNENEISEEDDSDSSDLEEWLDSVI
ncbi:unnamed protein product [Oikopleura dioica]|uniref:Uncharacterized protein n=1 Tax=Oikopleura dioica TaxID=34765 RepID=E4XP39_OIKDI|nr:unnamed protein product [Oikopleura dioica]